jgi:hypothetical protein
MSLVLWLGLFLLFDHFYLDENYLPTISAFVVKKKKNHFKAEVDDYHSNVVGLRTFSNVAVGYYQDLVDDRVNKRLFDLN